MSISVNDPLTGGTYSGLKEVSYRVYSQNILTQEGTLYSFNKSNPKQSDLRSKWTGSITVDSAKNNSNDVRVVVYAKDNAANDSEGVAKLKIDTTAPRLMFHMITILPTAIHISRQDELQELLLQSVTSILMM